MLHRALPLLFVVLLAACGEKTSAPGPAASGTGGPPPLDVDVIEINSAPTTLTQDLPGRLQALRSAQVRARVEGVVEAQLFADGASVRAGQPLFRLDARHLLASRQAAEAELATARALLDRYKSLQVDNVVSAQEFETQKARVASAEAALARARLDVDNAVPAAPIAGRAGRALVTEGALVGRGEATHLVTVEQIDPIRVEFTQSQADVLALRKLLAKGARRADSAPINLLLEDGSLYPHAGKLKFSDMGVDPATGALLLRAEFPNPQQELLPGSFVRVRYPQAVLESAVRVPQRAVLVSNAGRSVMVVDKDNKVEPRLIEVGAMSDGEFVVEKGLVQGERVIVNGVQKAKPGMTVNPQPWQPGAPVIAAKPNATAGK
jgi:membrane fusion protein (multidrug efflux system)